MTTTKEEEYTVQETNVWYVSYQNPYGFPGVALQYIIWNKISNRLAYYTPVTFKEWN